jgi:hypothetical protein
MVPEYRTARTGRRIKAVTRRLGGRVLSVCRLSEGGWQPQARYQQHCYPSITRAANRVPLVMKPYVVGDILEEQVAVREISFVFDGLGHACCKGP